MYIDREPILRFSDFENGFVHSIDFLPEDYAFFNLIKMRNYSHFKFKKQILIYGFNHRYHDTIIKTKKIIDRKQLGKIIN